MQKLPECLLGLTYKRDGRTEHVNEVEINRRRGAFLKGWNKAVKGAHYTRLKSTLSKLTWQNYGYRLGLLEGDVEDDIKKQLFEILLESQQRRINQEKEVQD